MEEKIIKRIKGYQIVRKNVNSSNIVSVGFMAEKLTAGVLEVEFWKGSKPGPIWRYWPVHLADFNELLKSDSAGKVFNSKIKGNKNINQIQMS